MDKFYQVSPADIKGGQFIVGESAKYDVATDYKFPRFIRIDKQRMTFGIVQLGDCLEVMKTLPGGLVDMVLADPPYQATRNKWDVPLPMDELWKEIHRVCKKNAVIALHSGGMFTAKLMNSNPKDWRYNLVWHKTTPTGFLNANRMPLRAHEDICVFYRKTPVTYHPQKTYGHERKVSTADHHRNSKKSTDYGEHGWISYDSTERYPTSVLTFSTDKQRGAYHSTQKPVKLEEWLIKTYTDRGDVVLDFCMGSGSTGVAAMNTGRSFIGIEINEEYYQIAAKRMKEAGENYSGSGGER